MTPDFRIDVSWPAQSANRKDDAAEIRVIVGGHSVTHLYDFENQMATDAFRAPATPLALFLADNWWRLNFEPLPADGSPNLDWRMHHELTAISSAITWPPAMIYGTGEKVTLAPRAGTTRVPGPESYSDLPVVSVDLKKFEAGVDDFFNAVLAVGMDMEDGAALRIVLEELSRERDDADLSTWRKLEAQLGYGPDGAPLELMTKLGLFQSDWGATAISEAAVAAPGPRSAQILEEALDAVSAGMDISRDVARQISSKHKVDISSRPAWEEAESAAAELRRSIGLDHGPVRGKAFGDILHVRWENARSVPAILADSPYGAVARLKNAKERLAFHSPPYARPRRFELARTLGDAFWEPLDNFAPLSRAKTERQKFQRAFAQSFLCPFNDLLEYIDTDKPNESHIEAASVHFHVSDQVVRTILVNKHLLPRESLSDRLEAA